jgi:chloramphenicol 3-O phosphotransferase
MTQGNIIFLNGTSSSGKTSMAKALQEIMDGYYIHTGIDHFLDAAPDKIHASSNGINPSTAEGFLWVRSNGDNCISELRAGPAALRLWAGMHGAAAALAAAGNDVIIDDVIFDSRVLQEAVNTLHTFNVLFVGVRCPLEIAEEREQARGNRTQGLVKAHYDLVHAHGVYDLEVDTSVLTAMECANQIKDRMQNGPAPDALRRLRNNLKSKKENSLPSNTVY